MPRLFVSYSHQDVKLVQPVVELLRARGGGVFQDVDSIVPGSKWRREIEEALSTAETFMLFWCHHSSRSAEVKAECAWVLAAGTEVLPVLLDGTPLPAPLNEFQWVDFQHLVGGMHRSSRRWVTRAVVLLLMVGLVSFASYSFLVPNHDPKFTISLQPPGGVEQPPRPPGAVEPVPRPPGAVEPVPPPPGAVEPVPLWIFGLAIMAAILGILVIQRVRQGRQRQSARDDWVEQERVNLPPGEAPSARHDWVAQERVKRPPGEALSPQEQMANELYAELVRRGTGST